MFLPGCITQLFVAATYSDNQSLQHLFPRNVGCWHLEPPFTHSNHHHVFFASFFYLATEIFSIGSSAEYAKCRFRTVLAATIDVCSLSRNAIEERVPKGGRLVHLLWALHFLKVHSTETLRAIVFHCTEMMFRKSCWCFIRLLATLNTVMQCTTFFIYSDIW